MNKQLELFLSRCELGGVQNGEMQFEVEAAKYFIEMQVYADSLSIGEDSLIHLWIIVDKRGDVICELWAYECDAPLDRSPVFRTPNATLESIEKWVLKANKDAAKLYVEPSEEAA